MEAHYSGEVGSAAGQFQNRGAAEAVADRGDALEVGEFMPGRDIQTGPDCPFLKKRPDTRVADQWVCLPVWKTRRYHGVGEGRSVLDFDGNLRSSMASVEK